MSEPVATAAPGKDCGACTLCCKVMRIDALGKADGTWCDHCAVGSGCKIHTSKPDECTVFYCGFLQDPRLGEEWRPSKSKFVLVAEMGGRRIAAHVDPQRPLAWREEPYYSQLKQWARDGAASGLQVTAQVGRRVWVLLPDRDVDLGLIGDGERIVVEQVKTPLGIKLEAAKRPA
ncbi:MAG TPA: hypothetical protein VFS04_02115 [Alphaproteobacteria bacterium]|nr:hypothetical protein [Alphaproteobacteria bacterium]